MSVTDKKQDNYFNLLGLAVNFELDKKVLTENYRRLQRAVHPDKFANSSDLEKRLSVQKSAQINDAYQTLKNPLKRAIYQLSLLGAELQDNATHMDTSFLMQQMDLREKLESISNQVDKGKDKSLEAINKMQNDVSLQSSSSIKQLSKLFSLNNKSAIDEIRNIIVKMQFFKKLQDQCDELEEQIITKY